MSAPITVMPSWIGEFAVRLLVVFLGLMCSMLALDLLGFAKATNPFKSWSGLWEVVGLTVGLSLLLGVEIALRHYGWIIKEPQKPETTIPPGNLPLN